MVFFQKCFPDIHLSNLYYEVMNQGGVSNEVGLLLNDLTSSGTHGLQWVWVEEK